MRASANHDSLCLKIKKQKTKNVTFTSNQSQSLHSTTLIPARIRAFTSRQKKLILTKTRNSDIRPVLSCLHWFPVCHRIRFKVLLLINVSVALNQNTSVAVSY